LLFAYQKVLETESFRHPQTLIKIYTLLIMASCRMKLNT